MARTRTLAELRADVRWQFDFESMTGRVTDAKLNRAINQSIQELRELVSDAGNPYFLATPQTGSLTVGPTAPHTFGTISLPATFVRAYGLDIFNTAEWVSLKPANFEERTMWGDGVTNQTPEAFFLFNGTQLGIVPAPDQGYQYKLYYLPTHTDLVADGDTFDGIAGWEDWVVFNTGNRLLLRDNQGEQYAAFSAERDRRLAGILARSNHRQRAGATTRVDVRGSRRYW